MDVYMSYTDGHILKKLLKKKKPTHIDPQDSAQLYRSQIFGGRD